MPYLPTTVHQGASPTWLAGLQVGDSVLRLLSGTIPDMLRVMEVRENLFVCSKSPVHVEAGLAWTFDRATGAEVDEDLGYGPPPKATGSFIVDPAAQVNVPGGEA